MPRPTPTSTISLFDFAGAKAAETLQHASEVTGERRRQKRRALGASGGDGAPLAEALFASRVDRGALRSAPRRLPTRGDARAGVGGDENLPPTAVNKDAAKALAALEKPLPSPSLARQQRADELRQRAQDLAVGLRDDSGVAVDTAGAHDQLVRAFANYSTAEAGGDGESASALAALEEWVTRSTTCCICIETIHREDRIWSCPQCAVPTHLGCIQTWSSRLIKFAQNQNMKITEPWCCPNCRHPFKRSDYPSEYACFCGKEVDPRPDPWILPHSCGEHCERELPCGHTCKLLCHPGRCPPCPLAVSVECHCGATRRTMRCGNPSFSCEAVCGRMLACGKHKCPRKCHSDECGPCETKIISACRCGRKKKMLVCAEAGDFQCDLPCGRTKPCGIHKCEVVCCNGECPPCPTEKVCACGRTRVQVDCRDLEAVKVRCEHTCNKLLDCRKHRCTRRCHDGPCSPCQQRTTLTCRCGKTTKEGPCGQELLCESKCNKELNCERHKCHRRCCDGNCPPCSAPCGRKLDCGVCRCTQVCGHGGFDSLGAELYNCPPCTKQSEVRCFCGSTAIFVPCGLPKKAPPCLELCQIPPTCHHNARLPHRCHQGPCPPCDQECGMSQACGHICRRSCHDPVVELDLSGASWARRQRGQTLADVLQVLVPASVRPTQVICPPCEELVERTCLGGHTQAKFKCHELPWFACDQLCGNMLPCGNHQCERKCHPVLNRRAETDFERLWERFEQGEGDDACEEDREDALSVQPPAALEPDTLELQAGSRRPPPDASEPNWACSPGSDFVCKPCKPGGQSQPQPTECGECPLECMRPRPLGCKHKCPWPCHFEPCPPCFEDVRLQCYCGQSLLTYACCEVLSWPSTTGSGEATENPFLRCPMVCHRTYDSCPHMCTARCHFGPCPPCGKQDVTVRCKCGRVRKQLPCSEAWKEGKQTVLECDSECKAKAAVEAEARAEKAAAEAAEAAAAAGADDTSKPGEGKEDLRERRKEKRKKRDEELEERSLREEAEKKRQAFNRRIRIYTAVGIIVLFILFLCRTVVVTREQELKAREERLAEREQGRRTSGWADPRSGQDRPKRKRSPKK